MQAEAGESIGITLTEQVFVARGAVAALETAPPFELARFKARVFWLFSRAAFTPAKTFARLCARRWGRIGVHRARHRLVNTGDHYPDGIVCRQKRSS